MAWKSDSATSPFWMVRNVLIMSMLILTKEKCAILCKKVCGNQVFFVILQCIQGVSAWESPSDVWEKVLHFNEIIIIMAVRKNSVHVVFVPHAYCINFYTFGIKKYTFSSLHLHKIFVPLTCSQSSTLENKNKKICFCFVFCSLIRTFAAQSWNTFILWY